MIFETIQEGVHEGLSLKEVIPFWVVQVRSHDRGFFAISFPHQFKEGIDLFGFEGQIPQFVDQEQIVAAEAMDEFGAGSICQRGVEFVQEILGVIEASPVSGEQSLT